MNAKTVKLNTVPEAAARWGVTQSKVRRMILEKEIEVVKIGKSVRIPEEEIERIIAEGWRKRVGK